MQVWLCHTHWLLADIAVSSSFVLNVKQQAPRVKHVCLFTLESDYFFGRPEAMNTNAAVEVETFLKKQRAKR